MNYQATGKERERERERVCVREREREEGVMKPNNIKSENQIEINKWIRKILKTKKNRHR